MPVGGAGSDVCWVVMIVEGAGWRGPSLPDVRV